MTQMLAPMDGAMVICRGIACFIGYPFDHDPTFTNLELLLTFSATLDACAQSKKLWHFNPVDVATIFSPLIDYAELAEKNAEDLQEMTGNCLKELKAADIETVQMLLNFDDALHFVTEIDELARVQNSWSKWFGFIRYSKTLEMEGLPKYLKETLPIDTTWDPNIGIREIPFLMTRAMSEEMATENFFDSCLYMRNYIMGYNAFKASFLSLAGRIRVAPHHADQMPKAPPVLTYETSHNPVDKIEADGFLQGVIDKSQSSEISNSASTDSSDPFLSPYWTIASELRGQNVRVSPRMALLLHGSIEEPRNTNWFNKGRFESAPLK